MSGTDITGIVTAGLIGKITIFTLNQINMKTCKWPLLLSGLSFTLFSCDPGLAGDLKVFNDSVKELTVVVVERRNSDSTVFAIPANSNKTIKVLGGLGNQETFDCCPCETGSVTIKSVTGPIKKDPNIKENWDIPNKEQQKKFGREDLRCEFRVTDSDL